MMNATDVDSTSSPEYYLSLSDHVTFFLLLGFLSTVWAFNFYYRDHGRPLFTAGITGDPLPTLLAAISIAASCVPPIFSIGILSQVYLSGTVIWFHFVGFFFAIAITAHVYISVFYKTYSCNSFQYIEKRFGPWFRILVAAITVIQYVCFLPFVVMTPAIALQHALNCETWVVFILIFIVLLPPLVCNSTLATAWNDLLTYVLFIALLIILMVLKLMHFGGIDFIWSGDNAIAFQFPSLSGNYTDVYTIWTLLIGSTITWCTFLCFNPFIMDKCLAVRRADKAQIAIWMSMFLIGLIITFITLCGLIAYDTYLNCDPMLRYSDFRVENVVIQLIMSQEDTKYILGTFIACVIAATAGYIGFAFYTLTNIALIEVLRPFSVNIIDKLHRLIMVLFLFAILCPIFVQNHVNNVFMTGLQIFTAFGGPLFGLFTLALFIPWATKQGAVIGLIIGLITSLWMTTGHLIYYPDDESTLPTSLLDCEEIINTTSQETSANSWILKSIEPRKNSLFDPMYKFSYLWIAPISSGIVFFIGLIMSIFWCKKSPEVDIYLLCSPISYLLKLYRSRRQRDVESLVNEDQIISQSGPSNKLNFEWHGPVKSPAVIGSPETSPERNGEAPTSTFQSDIRNEQDKGDIVEIKNKRNEELSTRMAPEVRTVNDKETSKEQVKFTKSSIGEESVDNLPQTDETLKTAEKAVSLNIEKEVIKPETSTDDNPKTPIEEQLPEEKTQSTDNQPEARIPINATETVEETKPAEKETESEEQVDSTVSINL